MRRYVGVCLRGTCSVGRVCVCVRLVVCAGVRVLCGSVVVCVCIYVCVCCGMNIGVCVFAYACSHIALRYVILCV